VILAVTGVLAVTSLVAVLRSRAAGREGEPSRRAVRAISHFTLTSYPSRYGNSLAS
jgi:hypothetical protein